ncbi:unnamed protein product [Plutella xylostella]|uniref:(diamondback moth) hypothetical protein n=1 Tax=Plutella xylostella TaxID=51655 RepID=A0A8S4E1K2_PLUXY|nr:unnamed protein product [Plutella xylostella]
MRWIGCTRLPNARLLWMFCGFSNAARAKRTACEHRLASVYIIRCVRYELICERLLKRRFVAISVSSTIGPVWRWLVNITRGDPHDGCS